MTNSYIAGFTKRAQEHGFSEDEALAVYKKAAEDSERISDSNIVGRYLNMHALRSQAIAEQPTKTTLHTLGKGIGGAALGGLGGAGLGAGAGALAALLSGHNVGDYAKFGAGAGGIGGAYAGEYGGLLHGMVSGSQGNTEEARKNTFNDVNKQLDERSTFGNAAHSAKNFAIPMGALGLLAGGAMGYATNGNSNSDKLSGVLGGGLAGAGALYGGIGGGVTGLLNSIIHNNTSKSSQDRAGKMLARHPYATAGLPFGDIVGANDA